MRAHRARLREQGLRPVQIWVPDVRSPQFATAAHAQSAAVAAAEHETDDQAFIDALSADLDTDEDSQQPGVNRGELYTAAARGAYTGTPRPVVLVQDDRFDATASITVCAVTTDPTEAPLLRLPIEPDETNGLSQPSSLMVDTITTMPRSALGERIGRLADADMLRLSRALVVFLGLGGRLSSHTAP